MSQVTISALQYLIALPTKIIAQEMDLTLWRPAAFGDFWKKQRLNARGFAQEFLQSGMLYRPGKSLKTRGKSSSLHS